MPAERNIVASKPFNGVIETEKVAVSPTVRIWELGDAAIEKDWAFPEVDARKSIQRRNSVFIETSEELMKLLSRKYYTQSIEVIKAYKMHHDFTFTVITRNQHLCDSNLK